MRPKFDAVSPEYTALWAGMTIRPKHRATVRATAQRICDGRQRYEIVTKATGVPWFVVGLLHNMECSLNFRQHLHNGDPLDAPTRRVPAGRGPFDSWEESAIDAIRYDGLDKITDWSVARVAYMAEGYNGWGYRNPKINHPSPYLWSFTSVYEKGKFVADGKYSPFAVSEQCGVMAILKELADMTPEAAFAIPAAVPVAPKAVVETTPSPSLVKEAAKSKSVRYLVGGALAWLEAKVQFVKGLLPDAQKETSEVVEPLTALGGMLKVNIEPIIFAVVLGVIVVVIYRHARDKAELARMKGDAQ